jgi:3-methyladenine DNA glycosylase AlkD
VDNHASSIGALQRHLDARASPKTKAWWEAYLRQAIRFRGVKMDAIRQAVHEWVTEEQHANRLAPRERVDLALRLVREQQAEDKLAGILYLHEILIPEDAVVWRRDVPGFASLFDQGSIADWNTCDWFCVKVIDGLIARDGEACARTFGTWRRAGNLWRRRASAVGFVNHCKRGDQNFAGFTDLVFESYRALLASEERFAQTGAGWVLRERSLGERDRVTDFVEAHLTRFTRESLRSAVAKLPDRTAKRLLRAHRAR